ncbi:LLM class flavin-dependent oxidoreductase [Acidiferrimicrobium sp. IK]|uniref:LLM class flavin-dependent oxidoreductase n=1 Tax=Acidiferrimicrobium sp. IK TaxID=2871700 RepID=UPI0021CB40D7|nr:LLM class flavin-dependent oxidoreductase [Acidiferrimicrobium sp. IK]MCU4185226.1 LLM class flavin-dependent oxidoreductase [Acidiferrimicrobium sp. IK]
MTGGEGRGFEIGVFTFGEVTGDPVTGRAGDPARRLREFVDLARIADQAGLDVFGVGEHHRPDFAISSPPVVLAAVAQVTGRLRLTSTVSVLSTADPVKLFEDFATVDLLSGGRAEITAGRGAYTESFPLFGHDIADYDELFEEKLDLLLQLNRAERVTWSGRHRAPLADAGVYPRPVQGQLPVWIAVGGTPASVVRAGRHGLSLYLAILGQPDRFVPLADLYRRSGVGAGHDPAALRVGVTSHFYVEDTSQGARDTFYPYYSRYIGENMPAARGQVLPRDAFDAWAGPHGALVAGSPQEVIDKILWEHELLGHDRFLAQIGLGGLPFAETARSIELLATEVLPVVRRETAPASRMNVGS